MSSQLQDEQPLCDRAVCDGMVSSTPEDWNVIVLTLERTAEAKVGELLHSLSSPEGHAPASPDETLFEATRKLDELFDRHSKRFTRAVYTVELLADSWKYRAEFDYGPPGQHPTGAASS